MVKLHRGLKNLQKSPHLILFCFPSNDSLQDLSVIKISGWKLQFWWLWDLFCPREVKTRALSIQYATKSHIFKVKMTLPWLSKTQHSDLTHVYQPRAPRTK